MAEVDLAAGRPKVGTIHCATLQLLWRFEKIIIVLMLSADTLAKPMLDSRVLPLTVSAMS